MASHYDDEYDQENPDEDYDYENGEFDNEEDYDNGEENLLQKSSGSVNNNISKNSASQQGTSAMPQSLIQRKNHPFFDKLFDRVDGLLCILISNAEGSLLHTSVAKTQQPIPEFTSAFAAAFHLASEQANKIPQLGLVDYFLSFYKDFIVVQWSTKTSNTPPAKEANASNLLEEEMLYVTMIGNKNLSVQLLLNFKTIIRDFAKKIF